MYNRDKLGYDVRLILTRIAIFQSENVSQSQQSDVARNSLISTIQAQRNQRLYISRNSKTTLESFCDWQARTKPAANSILAYDHAFLFTG